MEINEEIVKAKEEGANLLLPSTKIQGLSEFHAPVVDSVYLSPDPQNGDVYPENSNNDSKLRISAQGLRKLAVCAGIVWRPTECKRTDNRQDRNYVSYQATGGIKKADGAMVFWKGEYDLDFEVVEAELRELHCNKSKNWRKSDEEKKAYVESSVRRDLIFKRKHKIKLAETGAANRVIRAILGLKSAYTKAELSKPFVMVRIVFQPDYSDPEVKRQVTTAAIQAMTGIYGTQSQSAPVVDIPPEDFHDISAEEDEPEPSPPASNDGETEKSGRLTKEDFATLPFDEQLLTLEEMAQEKGYTVPVPIKDMDEHNRERLFDHLDALPVPAKSDADNSGDIPF